MHGISLSYSTEHERNTLIKYLNENIGIKVQENEWMNIHTYILGSVVVWEYRENGKNGVYFSSENVQMLLSEYHKFLCNFFFIIIHLKMI